MGWKSFDKYFHTVLNTTLRAKNKNKFQTWFLYFKLFHSEFSRLPFMYHRFFHNVKSDLYTYYIKRQTILWYKSPTCTVSVDISRLKHVSDTRLLSTIECNFDKNIGNHVYFPSEDKLLLNTTMKSSIIDYRNADNGLHMFQLQDTQSVSCLKDLVPPDPNPNKLSPEIQQNQNIKLQQLIEEYQEYGYLDLSRQELTDEDMEFIAKEVIIKKQCKQLWLSSNNITSIGVSILAQALNDNKTLECLDLSNNQVSDDGIHLLVNELSMNNKTLMKIGLANNGITDKGIEHLAEMIKTNKTLKQIDLCSNEISDEGIQILANAMKKYNSTIEVLWLISNKLLTDKSIASLIQMVKHSKSLKKIWVFKCNFSEIGKGKLKELEQLKRNFKVYVNNWKQ